MSPAEHPRRWFLAGGAAVVVGGGVGVGAGFLHHRSAPRRHPAPRDLVAALATELDLLALATAAVRRDAALRATANILVRDHSAHVRALRSALAAYDVPRRSAAASPSASGVPSAPSQAQVRATERAAAATAATRAGRLTGTAATLLASISACEATHGELLA
ncbi:hypothetical protein [uncultured Jatrophihabitans sp.]|uniref:hypothetical protein n=1 Tax=uncultured Jatrophihabitans sp. TaxID=1610747 RepID=UPI0035CB16F7